MTHYMINIPFIFHQTFHLSTFRSLFSNLAFVSFSLLFIYHLLFIYFIAFLKCFCCYYFLVWIQFFLSFFVFKYWFPTKTVDFGQPFRVASSTVCVNMFCFLVVCLYVCVCCVWVDSLSPPFYGCFCCCCWWWWW